MSLLPGNLYNFFLGSTICMMLWATWLLHTLGCCFDKVATGNTAALPFAVLPTTVVKGAKELDRDMRSPVYMYDVVLRVNQWQILADLMKEERPTD